VIVKMPGDFAIRAWDRAATVIDDYPEIVTWAIGGHSLGGVFSCAYAQKNSEDLDGVVLWAAYPSEAFRVDDKDLTVISLYGTNDGVVTLDDIGASEEHVPPDTLWVPIEGGNHTQFGWYDTSPDPLQQDDYPADITRQQQQDYVVDSTSSFLESLGTE
jgi:pimeloyl-ACP methyl ester carboxylesterase